MTSVVRAERESARRTTNLSALSKLRSYAPGVVGKSGDCVLPPTYAFPAVSTAIPTAPSAPLPPR
jgi:hypothetical protein